MKIALFAKKYDKDFRPHLQQFVSLLEEKGIEIFVYQSFWELIKNDIKFNKKVITFTENTINENVLDFLFSIGGDGTLLSSVSLLKNSNIPVVGINMGHLGFLTTVTKNNLETFITDIIKGNYKIEDRSLLHIEYQKNSATVLNELSIHRDTAPTLLSVDVFVDNEFLATYSGDGLIIASPTGSTAYSLSCGGPILTPNSNCLVLTPIAVHTLTFRPIIIPDSAKIKLITHCKNPTLCVGLDSNSATIPSDNEIHIEKEKFTMHLVRMGKQTFYTALRDKLMWGIDCRN